MGNETKKPLTSENSLLKVKSDLQEYKTTVNRDAKSFK